MKSWVTKIKRGSQKSNHNKTTNSKIITRIKKYPNDKTKTVTNKNKNYKYNLYQKKKNIPGRTK